MQNSKSNHNGFVQLPDNYDPVLDIDYMSPNMLQFFKQKLEAIHQEIIIKEDITSHSLIEHPNNEAEVVDRGEFETRTFNEFMLQEHDDHTRHEVEDALERIANGTYGYCLETKRAIGLERLLSVPTAKYTTEVQAFKEGAKKL